MKLTRVVIASVCATAVSPAALAQQVAQTNATMTAPLVTTATNSSSKGHASIQGNWRCFVAQNGVTKWWYHNWSNGPYACTTVDASQEWCMLNAYRAGGQVGVHWKYTNNENDGECLTNWKYYTADGQTMQATIPRTTMVNDNRRWCALPVYRQGGVKGKQWDDCACWMDEITWP